MNDHQEKALKEGCCEIEQAHTDVSSTEKTNTKEDLARVMAKSKTRHKQSLMDVSVKRQKN